MNFLADLSDPLRLTLMDLGAALELDSGGTLIESGDRDPSFYLLCEGELTVARSHKMIVLTPGHVVGAVGFLDHGPRFATVLATRPSRVLAFRRQEVMQALADRPLLLNELISKLLNLGRDRLSEFAIASESMENLPIETEDSYLETLVTQAFSHRAVHHPYLQALASGSLPDTRAALEDFANLYIGYSSHFPRYLTALISRLVNPAHRRALLENLTEESGHYDAAELQELALHGIQSEWIVGIAHPDLFRRFRRAIRRVPGQTAEPFGERRDGSAPDEHIEVVCWREMFLSILSNGSPAEALGALGLGTEAIVRTIYRPFVAAIDRLGTIAPEDAVFFPLHTTVDDHHQATLRAIASDFATTASGREDLSKGMHKALALRDSFWTFLHQRALAMPAAA